MTTKRTLRKRAIGERLVPWFEGAVTVVSAVIATFWLVALLLACLAALGFYLVAFVVFVPAALLVMRLGGWKVRWRELFKEKAK